jgi:hypothetical protein
VPRSDSSSVFIPGRYMFGTAGNATDRSGPAR